MKFKYIGAPKGFPRFCFVFNYENKWEDGHEWDYGMGAFRLVYSDANPKYAGYAVCIHLPKVRKEQK